MIYTKIWKEYGYKKENSSEANIIGIEYLIDKVYGIYCKDSLIYRFKWFKSKRSLHL